MRSLVLELHDRRGEVSDAIGMSYLRAKALSRLTPGPLSQRELSAALMTDAPYTTVILDDLEKRGLVRRGGQPRRPALEAGPDHDRGACRRPQGAGRSSQHHRPRSRADRRELEVLDRTLRRLVEHSEETQ